MTCLQDLVAVPENGRSRAKGRTDTWMVGIPGCGHNMVFEQPEALKRLIIEYIESVTARPGPGGEGRKKGYVTAYGREQGGNAGQGRVVNCRDRQPEPKEE